MSRSRMVMAVGFGVLFATDRVLALEDPIKWMDDSEAGVAAAQKSSLPILFLVLPPSDAPETVKDKAAAPFRDPAVARLVGDRFVAVRLSESRATERLLKRLNASNAGHGSAVIATPGGSKVDIIATDNAQDVQALAHNLAGAFGKYQAKVLADSVAPVLGNEEAKSDALLEALGLVKILDISEADDATAKLLDRKKLADAVRSAAYDTLAALSTEKAIAKLLDAGLQDQKAADALRSCSPAGAAALLPALELADRDRLVLAYNAMVAICSIDEAKPAEFWQGDDKTSQKAEIERMKARVSACAESWRASRDQAKAAGHSQP